MINVTKTFLPPKEEFLKYVSEIFDRNILTNQGPLVLELEKQLKNYLKANNFQYVTNGTIALQLAIKILGTNEGEIITTPFSYVATTSSILWEKHTPVFADIEPDNFTIAPTKIEELITNKTVAIMPVHVFGYACNIDAIKKIADEHNLKVIYDAAHTFGSKYKGKQLSTFGDISTLSFHATKIFHTIEGGGILCNDRKYNDKIELMKRFGHNSDNHQILGINAKQDEFNAAMGLCNLKHIDEIITKRKHICELYDELLSDKIKSGQLKRPRMQKDLEYNYSYYPIIFDSEKTLLKTFEILKEIDVFPRRYFYPSLNTLPYLNSHYNCPISEDITKRIACLPLYAELTENNVISIINKIKKVF